MAGLELLSVEDLNTMSDRFPFNSDPRIRAQVIPISTEAVERNPLLAALVKGGKSDVDPAKVQDISAAMEKAGRESTASRPCQTCGKQRAEELELRALDAPLFVAMADNLKTFARAAAEEVFPALSSALGLLTANPIHTTHALVVRATWHPEIKDATLAFTLDGAAPMPHADLEALLSGYGYDLVGYFSQDALNNVHGMKGAREGLNRCMAVWIAKWNGKLMPSGVPSIEGSKTENLTRDELASQNDPNWFESLQARLKYSGLPSASPGGRASPRDFQRFERKY